MHAFVSIIIIIIIIIIVIEIYAASDLQGHRRVSLEQGMTFRATVPSGPPYWRGTDYATSRATNYWNDADCAMPITRPPLEGYRLRDLLEGCHWSKA